MIELYMQLLVTLFRRIRQHDLNKSVPTGTQGQTQAIWETGYYISSDEYDDDPNDAKHIQNKYRIIKISYNLKNYRY